MKKTDIKAGLHFCHKGDCYRIESGNTDDTLFLYRGMGIFREIVATIELITQRSIHVYTYWLGERVERCIFLQELSPVTAYQYEHNNPFLQQDDKNAQSA